MNWRIAGVVAVALAVLGGVWLLIARLERELPAVTWGKEVRFIGARTTVDLAVEDRKSGLSEVSVRVRQGTSDKEALSEKYPGGWPGGGRERRRQFAVVLEAGKLGLEQGPATVVIYARDHSWWRMGRGNVTVVKLPVTVDTIPPRIDLLSTVNNVSLGGTGLVTYRLNEDPALTGVEVGENFFSGYPESTGGKRAFVAYFALPYDSPSGIRISLMAADPAGNVTRKPVPVRILAKKFTSDSIKLSDTFLQSKMAEFSAADPGLGTDPLQAFLKVNRDWRQRDHRKLREVCSVSRAERVWSGPFIQMRNTKSMATYAQARSYTYQGKEVDQQVHMGLDLASTAGAPVPAGNAGVVALAGDLGIYGQAVLLDHGQGLFSLYTHLSGIGVSQGQRVDKGQIVGSSGQTGMAGGDHLHFATLVGGIFVSPVEWLDEHWITDNVQSKLSLLTPLP